MVSRISAATVVAQAKSSGEIETSAPVAWNLKRNAADIYSRSKIISQHIFSFCFSRCVGAHVVVMEVDWVKLIGSTLGCFALLTFGIQHLTKYMKITAGEKVTHSHHAHAHARAFHTSSQTGFHNRTCVVSHSRTHTHAQSLLRTRTHTHTLPLPCALFALLQMKSIIAVVSSRQLLGLMTGIVVTALLQSSNAVWGVQSVCNVCGVSV